jgi:CRP-like cAMP-binding protein
MVNVEFLQSHALFGGIGDVDIKAIQKHLQEERFSQGEFLAKEGEAGDRLYFICKGSVEVLKKVHNSPGFEQVTLAVFGKGDTIGEMELIDIQARSASVRALEDVLALSLSNQAMYEIYKEHLDVFAMLVLNIAREISRRLRRMDALVDSSLFSSPPEIDTFPRSGTHKITKFDR